MSRKQESKEWARKKMMARVNRFCWHACYARAWTHTHTPGTRTHTDYIYVDTL